MATSAPSSPTRRRVSPVEADADEQAPGLQPTSRATRSPQRLGTSEIPRTYSGMYGEGAPPMPDIRSERDDGDEDEDGGGSALSPPGADPSSSSSSFSPPSSLLPFELSRNRNTEWLAASGPALLATYLSVIVACLLTLLAYVDEPKAAWTAGNALHVLVSIVYLHWIKGNPADFMDGTQGEMNAMTTWEQIVCKPASHLEDPDGGPAAAARAGKSRNLREIATAAVRRLRSRDVLVVVPTLLALASCYVAEFQFEYAMANVGMWACLMLPKMPAMNGVRILGINRTAGIDDGEEECLDAEVDAAKGGVQETNESKKDL